MVVEVALARRTAPSTAPLSLREVDDAIDVIKGMDFGSDAAASGPAAVEPPVEETLIDVPYEDDEDADGGHDLYAGQDLRRDETEEPEGASGKAAKAKRGPVTVKEDGGADKATAPSARMTATQKAKCLNVCEALGWRFVANDERVKRLCEEEKWPAARLK
jgi:hypothetical protein